MSEDQRKLIQQFQTFDRNGDGVVSMAEFQHGLRSLDIELKLAELDGMMAELGGGESGGIDYKKFVRQFDPDEHRLRRIFDDLDDDNSGALSAAELLTLTRDLGLSLTQRELDEAMREMDADGSGEVDFIEFSQWWRQARKRSAKVAAAVAQFQSQRDGGAVKASRPHGRPSGVAQTAEQTTANAKHAHLPQQLTRQKQPASAEITQLDRTFYNRQQHPGTMFGQTPVTVKPGQQRGAGKRQDHFDPLWAFNDEADANGYCPYRPDRNLPGKNVPERTGEAIVSNTANEDAHYLLHPPWASHTGPTGGFDPCMRICDGRI
jgi:calmodulin